MREIRTPGSVRGAEGNLGSYRDCSPWSSHVASRALCNRTWLLQGEQPCHSGAFGLSSYSPPHRRSGTDHIGVTDRYSQSIGGVVGFRRRGEGQDAGYHKLDLFFVRAADADNGVLNLRWRVLRPGKSSLCERQQNHP